MFTCQWSSLVFMPRVLFFRSWWLKLFSSQCRFRHILRIWIELKTCSFSLIGCYRIAKWRSCPFSSFDSDPTSRYFYLVVFNLLLHSCIVLILDFLCSLAWIGRIFRTDRPDFPTPNFRYFVELIDSLDLLIRQGLVKSSLQG